jgi:hypothetical protein
MLSSAGIIQAQVQGYVLSPTPPHTGKNLWAKGKAPLAIYVGCLDMRAVIVPSPSAESAVVNISTTVHKQPVIF